MDVISTIVLLSLAAVPVAVLAGWFAAPRQGGLGSLVDRGDREFVVAGDDAMAAGRPGRGRRAMADPGWRSRGRRVVKAEGPMGATS